jgi:hypothetical protein
MPYFPFMTGAPSRKKHTGIAELLCLGRFPLPVMDAVETDPERSLKPEMYIGIADDSDFSVPAMVFLNMSIIAPEMDGRITTPLPCHPAILRTLR